MTNALFGRWRAWVLFALLLSVAGWVLHEAQRNFRADVASSAARRQIVSWVSGESSPKADEWAHALRALQAALSITPDDPRLQETLGDLHVAAGQRDWADAFLRRQHFDKAAKSYLQAIALRPGEPQTWAMLALAYQASAARSRDVHAAWARALALGPFEGHVQPVLMEVVLADWEGAAPPMRAWASALFDNASASKRNGINAMALRYGLKFSPDEMAKP